MTQDNAPHLRLVRAEQDSTDESTSEFVERTLREVQVRTSIEAALQGYRDAADARRRGDQMAVAQAKGRAWYALQGARDALLEMVED